jgi:integrase
LGPVIVQQVVMPVSGAVSWTVLGDDGDPIEPVETYLTYLSALERSPNTQRAYATSLKLWFAFLGRIDIGWAEVGINEVARFVSWLRALAENVIGQALGLRHADFVSRDKEVWIVPRGDNANGARAKLRTPAVVPVTAGLVRSYSDYMFSGEYGDVDSDYVFVNLWGGRLGAALTYPAVERLVCRIRSQTGIAFTLHMLRHTHATVSTPEWDSLR